MCDLLEFLTWTKVYNDYDNACHHFSFLTAMREKHVSNYTQKFPISFTIVYQTAALYIIIDI